MPELAAWDSFYVIVGSSAAALIGLQFVVMTLIAEEASQRSAQAGAAYSTPTVLHFSAVLFLSAAVRAPWPALAPIATLWGLVGFGGVIYALVTTARMTKSEAYRPVLEDWAFHSSAPLAAYLALLGAALVVFASPGLAPFVAGAAVLTLLFVGIHNAWDGVAFHVFVTRPRARAARDSSQAKDNS